MITAIIPSKNRAPRLDLCLRSIEENCDIFDKILVVYSFGQLHEDSYQLLFSRFKKNKKIIFRQEIHTPAEEFYMAVNTLEYPYVCFITDDTVFHKKSPENKETILSCFDGKTVSFSLRLGYNTTIQDYRDGRKQKELFNEFEITKEIIKWDYNYYHKLENYGYPFGMDGCIFERDEIQNLIETINLKSIRDFESELCLNKRYLYEKRKPYLCSFKESVCVNIPVSSQLGGLHSSSNITLTPEQESEKYCMGLVLENKIDSVLGCHQEIDLKWRKFNG